MVLYFWSFFLIPPYVSCFWLILPLDEGWWQFLLLLLLFLTQKQNKKQDLISYFYFPVMEVEKLLEMVFFLFLLLFCKRLWFFFRCCCVPSPSIIIIIQSRKKTWEKWHWNPFSTSSDFLVIFLMKYFGAYCFFFLFIVLKKANLIFNRRWKYSCNIRYYVCHPTLREIKSLWERKKLFFYSFDDVTDVRWWC